MSFKQNEMVPAVAVAAPAVAPVVRTTRWQSFSIRNVLGYRLREDSDTDVKPVSTGGGEVERAHDESHRACVGQLQGGRDTSVMNSRSRDVTGGLSRDVTDSRLKNGSVELEVDIEHVDRWEGEGRWEAEGVRGVLQTSSHINGLSSGRMSMTSSTDHVQCEDDEKHHTKQQQQQQQQEHRTTLFRTYQTELDHVVVDVSRTDTETSSNGKNKHSLHLLKYKLLELKSHCCSHTMGSSPFLLD